MKPRVDERTAILINQYGECCTKAAAAKILGVGKSTIYRMIEDGRIKDACAGTKVDVRSIGAYLAKPAEVVRIERARARNSTRWAV